MKSRADLYEKYKDYREIYLKEYSKLKLSIKEASLVIVKYHTKNTLNLAASTKNMITKMRLIVKDIPVPNMIHLHKQNQEVIYNNLLKATLKVSKLQSTHTKIESRLRKEKVENKVHQK